MLSHLIFSINILFIIEGKHFEGGTITWAPINPYDNSSSVGITLSQSYSWTYPTITCATNVPVSTPGRSTQNSNLSCVVDCTTDGGYSASPVDILTDCTSVSASLGMLSSARSHNLTLSAGAHFYLANVGSAWAPLNHPTQSGLQWSIITFIDLRMRPDGFINTPPVASVASPQYVVVNQTVQINIPVSDVNAGDDVRCRWSTYTPGYRRKRRSANSERSTRSFLLQSDEKIDTYSAIVHLRNRRGSCGGCSGACPHGCQCACSNCDASACPGTTCNMTIGCENPITNTTTLSTTTGSTTPIPTTTIDTPGTLQSTSSYPHRQAIDECGGICYPGSVPNGTTLSGCTLNFTGLIPNTWYAVALQVEDFINSTSTTPMSSVPVQFLIYVMPLPSCSNKPVFFPLDHCSEVQVGVTITFNVSALNLCNPSVATLSAIVVSSGINGMTSGNLTVSTANSSIGYMRFTWTPQVNQIGSQQLCVVAYTSEKLQSDPYCITFTVKNSSDICLTTTTTSTSTTTQSTTSETTTSSSSSSSTTSSTSATTSTSSSTSSTSTSTTSTTSSTSTSSTSTSTSTTTTATSATTSTTTTATTTTATTTVASNKPIDWLLIVGLALLALLLAICCACCCLYRFLWGPGARRRRKRNMEKDDTNPEPFNLRNLIDRTRRRATIGRKYEPTMSGKDFLVNNHSNIKSSVSTRPPIDLHRILSDNSNVLADGEQQRIHSTVPVRKIKRADLETFNKSTAAYLQPPSDDDSNEKNSNLRGSKVTVVRVSKSANVEGTNKTNSNTDELQMESPKPTVTKKNALVHVSKIPRKKSSKSLRPRRSSVGHVNVTHVDGSSMEMKKMTARAKTSMSANDRKEMTGSAVRVKRLSRKSLTDGSNDT